MSVSTEQPLLQLVHQLSINKHVEPATAHHCMPHIAVRYAVMGAATLLLAHLSNYSLLWSSLIPLTAGMRITFGTGLMPYKFLAFDVLIPALVLSVIVSCDWSWHHWLTWTIGTYFLIGCGMSCTLHRYFAHCAYATSRPFQFLLGLFACLAFQGPPLWWAGKHVRHHHHCDLPNDPHSMKQRGFWYAFIIWSFNAETYSKQDYEYLDKRLLVPEVMILEELNDVPVIFANFAAYHYFGSSFCVLSVLLPMFLSKTITLLFNVQFHNDQGAKGDKVCKSMDGSNVPASIVGEGMHQDHHNHPRRSRRPGIDAPWYVMIAPLEAAGLIWNCLP